MLGAKHAVPTSVISPLNTTGPMHVWDDLLTQRQTCSALFTFSYHKPLIWDRIGTTLLSRYSLKIEPLGEYMH